MSAPDPRLDEIQARLDAATPGPWRVRECTPCTERGRLEVNIWDEPGNLLITNWCDDDMFHRPDAEFIAAAPADVRYLLAELRKALEALARVEALHSHARRDVEPWAIGYRFGGDHCSHDGQHWPCDTRAAVAAAKEAE